jgi:tRNA G18 (ribose-2'-O)-methylase SpoU
MQSKPHTREVSSLDLPELEPYRTLRRPLDHQKQGIFVAEGEKVVRRLLDSGLSVVSLLLTPQWFERIEGVLRERYGELRQPPPEIFISDQKFLERIVGFNLHQGIMAVARIPEERNLGELIRESPKPCLFIALDGLVNSENVGIVVRCAGAFGVDGIIVGETSSSPYLRRAVRNSMGAVFRLPVVHVKNLVETLRDIADRRIHVIAAHPDGNGRIFETDFRRDVCLVFGNEGEGISQQVLSVCPTHVAIPMLNHTDSINVASASAVFLYEVRRQRTAHSR